MKKNNLENLYQEKFKDFREIPDEQVWESITASLDKKDKKRVIPIWWKLGGVAALLALLFYVINPFEDRNIPVNQTTEVEENITDDKSNKNQKLSNDAIINPDKNNDTDNLVEIDKSESEREKIDSHLTDSELKEKGKEITPVSNSKGVVTTNIQNDGQNKNDKNKGRIAVAENHESNNNQDTEKLKNQINFKELVDEPEKTKVAASQTDVNEEKARLNGDKKQNLEKELSKKEEAVVNTEIKEEKKSIFDAIVEQKEEEVAIAESKENKWSVGPSIAPVYFDAVGQGSPIHSNFVENSKSGNINLSYGLTVAYKLGKRLKLRSGVHKVDYGYDTNEVVFSSSVASSSDGSIENINFSRASRTIVVESRKTNSNSLSDPSANDFSAQSPERDGRMSQQLGYLEVPLELNYTLVDKKVGVNLIGGVSSLFLVDNSVALESEGLVTQIGEANNVNSINFSTNVGVGFSYDFSPKVQINLEPVFKYQLNTFSDTAGSFNPYSVGVYSGVRFNF
ncbi:hypothetical protein MTsPCn9_14660 [Croceitalea sp. MTPC9]|uniref:hypothetical protein n=1 Tax=unclassified Croceitalea TaxID=2632280 RepID=UPI002B3FE9BA|nr:hypothetical protein MTsPCn6_14470 [Croceitalea sp. MTPC6]GMN16530.1 hypothetical protein MTsPCn9_14660 [Croceitalea sp. MTPC9]